MVRGSAGRRAALALAWLTVPALAACGSSTSPTDDARIARLLLATQDARVEEGGATGAMIDPEMTPDPESFAVEATVIWNGERTLQGVWIAHPEARAARRVRIVNRETGAAVDGALFRRDGGGRGGQARISSDAAVALGLDAGAEARVEITALRYGALSDADAPARDDAAGRAGAGDAVAEAADAPAGPVGSAPAAAVAADGDVLRVTPEMQVGAGGAVARGSSSAPVGSPGAVQAAAEPPGAGAAAASRSAGDPPAAAPEAQDPDRQASGAVTQARASDRPGAPPDAAGGLASDAAPEPGAGDLAPRTTASAAGASAEASSDSTHQAGIGPFESAAEVAEAAAAAARPSAAQTASEGAAADRPEAEAEAEAEVEPEAEPGSEPVAGARAPGPDAVAAPAPRADGQALTGPARSGARAVPRRVPGTGAGGDAGSRDAGDAGGATTLSAEARVAARSSPAESPAGDDALARPYVQAGIFAVSGNAARLIDRLRAAGLPAAGKPFAFRGRPATRVVAGPFRSAAARDAALAEIRRIGPDDALPVKE